MKHNVTNRPTPFFVTAPLPCPYLEGQTERRLVVELNGRDSTALHDTLSRIGFRRSHRLIYSPVCPGCQACKAVRTVVSEFIPSNSLRRVLRKNSDVQVCEAAPRATSEQYELFSAYQVERHHGGDMATMDYYDYQALVEETPVDSWMLEFRSRQGVLIAGCLIDRMGDGLSAVYSYYDPALPRRSLGTLMIILLIQRAAELGLPYVYLGYWIGNSSKMSYKERFQPLEYYAEDGWKSFVPKTQKANP